MKARRKKRNEEISGIVVGFISFSAALWHLHFELGGRGSVSSFVKRAHAPSSSKLKLWRKSSQQ